MDLMIGLSQYVLGNLQTEELPELAFDALIAGYETPSLIILAGLKDDVWEIDEYLTLTLKEMNMKLPSLDEAGLTIIKYYLEMIFNKKIDPVEGLRLVREDVLKKTNFYELSQEYVYDYIEFSYLYALYVEYDDLTDSIIWATISDDEREKLRIKIKDQIIIEVETFIKNFESIKSKVLNSK